MANNIFPVGMAADTKAKISQLAETVYNRNIKDIKKEEVLLLIQMDMATVINKINVGCSATRPTNIKFATNNYHASMEVDLAGIGKLITSRLESVPDDEIIDRYLELKSALYGMIKVKYESTETYLRGLLDVSIQKDGCPVTGRGDDE